MKFNEIFTTNRKENKLCDGIAWLLKQGFIVNSYSQDANTCQFIRRFILKEGQARGTWQIIANYEENHWEVSINKLSDFHKIREIGIEESPAELISKLLSKLIGEDVND